jgi:PEP-CTERM motif/Glycine rich protein
VIVRLVSPVPAEKAADQVAIQLKSREFPARVLGNGRGTKRMMKKRLWLAGASVLAIVLGSGAANAVVFDTPGFADYITPSTGWYDFRVAGAQGGGGGGAGAVVGGDVFLAAGTFLGVRVGGQGGDGCCVFDGAGGGGGGLSAIYGGSQPSLFIAGGGGGAGFDGYGGSGGPGLSSGGTNYGSGGAGGLGVIDPSVLANRYAGFTAVPATAGSFFNWNGGYGAKIVNYSDEPPYTIATGPNGGYNRGGGGGYNGGGGGGGAPGGGPGQGGSSYVTPLARDAFGITGGNHAGNGYVSIDFVGSSVPEPSTWAMMLAGFSLLGGMLVRRGKKPTTA